METYIICGWVLATITIISIIELIGDRKKMTKSNHTSLKSDIAFLFLFLGKVFLTMAGVLLFFEYVLDKI